MRALNQDTAPASTPPDDTANLLAGANWRHLTYNAVGDFESYGDTLLVAETSQVPGVYAHTPQIVAGGWTAEQGDSLYVSFQVRGTVSSFVLDINTGLLAIRHGQSTT